MVFDFSGAPGAAPAGAGGNNFEPAAAAPATQQPGAPISFGGGAPAANAPAGGGPATSSFQFPQPAAAGGANPISFGKAATTGNAPAAPATAGAPAPSFAFGSTSSNTPAPGSVGAPATPAPGANAAGANTSFGGPTTAPTATPAAPAAAGTGFGGGATATPVPAPAATGGFGGPAVTTTTALAVAAPAGPVGLEVPDFDTTFPNEKIYSDLKRLLSDSASPGEEGREAASELVDQLRCDGGGNNNDKSTGLILTCPKPLQYTPPDNNMRNQLMQNPKVVLRGTEAHLTHQMLQEVFKIADDLRISEQEALSLYAEAMQTNVRSMLETKLDESIIDQALSSPGDACGSVRLGTNAVKAAEELYFFERQRLLRTILMLVQSRIESAQQPWGDLIIRATDSLLQHNLVANLTNFIRNSTTLIGRINVELAKGESTHTHAFSGFTKEKKKPHFDTVHLKFALRERQLAAESLFFIAYHTQLSASEVAGIVDLVKDITNGLEGDTGLPVFNPFRDVPSSYEAPPQMDQAWNPYHQSSVASPKMKEHLEWQNELVKKSTRSTKCELLRCVSALVMTVISALDTRNVLMDRNTHSDNSIGVGNMLLPSGEQPGPGLDPIHQRLTSDGCRDWKRTDICGLLCGAYAMLLKAPSSLTSPRAGGSPARSRSLVRTFAECLSAPMLLKSISFAQLCLLPALQRPSNHTGAKCETSEFLLSVLSEFVANFMDVLSSSGNLPISRTSWEKEQKEALQLERENQKQKREFNMWVGDVQNDQNTQGSPVPNSVDPMHRPDCMDDVVALAVAVASQGPLYAMKFWEFAEEVDEKGNTTLALVPSRAYKQLKALVSEDNSLTPFYLAYSAALAKAESPDIRVGGADVVNSILSSTESPALNWNAVLTTLRWYFHQFDTSKTNAATVPRASGAPSTSYYYQNTSTTNSMNQGSTQSSSRTEPKKMGEANTFWLLSLLGLIATVSTKSPKSRLAILSMKLPIQQQNSSTVLGADTTLNILFSLLTGPLPPEVRGATLTAIASLLRMETLNEEEKTRMREFATSAWDLVESCQILPIMLLDQYPQAIGAANSTVSGLKFPAASVSLAGSGTSNSLIPLDQAFSILYEMVHVEAKTGVYPATEGFLSLLTALIRCCCPPELGQGMRLRLGCTPYVEYVMHFVLPMTTGSESKMGKLPFRSKADEARLFAKATEVIRTILVQYSFDTFPDTANALQLLGQETLVAKIVIADPSSSTGNNLEDFVTRSISYGQRGNAGQTGMQSPPMSQQQIRGPAASSIPSPKSPGFVVLSDLLSVSDGCILKALSTVLADNLSAFSTLGNESSNLAETYALFKETPPTLVSAKVAGKKDAMLPIKLAELLKGLRPNLEESLGYSSAVFWRECGIMNALQILCAALVREDAFYKTVNAASTPIRIVPVLRFDKRPGSTPQINSNNVQLSRFQDVLLAAREVVYSFMDYVGYSGTTDDHDASIAMSGLSLMYYVHQALPGNSSMETICGSARDGHKRLSYAVAKRLVTSFERESTADYSMLSLVFDWMVSNLRKGDTRLAHVLLGLSGFGDGHNSMPAVGRGPDDCFGAILDMLNRLSFIVERDTSKFAASCFEILVRITDLKAVSDPAALRQIIHCTERLRSLGFWRKHLGLFLMHEATLLQSAFSSGDPHVIHSMAWLLQGVASELHLMTGFCPAQNGAGGLIGYIAPRIGELDALLSLLFGADGQGVESVIHHLPIQIDDASFITPPQDAVRFAQRQLEGPPEFTDGYLVVDEKSLLSRLSTGSEDQSVGYQRWCQSWNLRVSLDCASSHLSNTLRVLVGAALVSCEADHHGARANSMACLLTAVLERLIGVSTSAQVSPMAARGLSFIALMLSKDVASVARDTRTGISDLRTVRDLLARSVVVSGREPGGAGKPLLQERTAILGAALIQVMQVLPYDDAEIDDPLFLEAALTLAELSAMVNLGEVSPVSGQPAMNLNGRKVALPTEATMVARSSLASLIEVFDQNVSAPVDSMAFTLLSERFCFGNNETCAKSLLRRVALLDEGITFLLEKLIQGPFVSNLLIEEGLLDSLLCAADTYMQEERAQQNRSFQQSNGQRVAIGFPSCLYKHLLLFRTLLITSDLLSEQHRRALPRSFYDFLQRCQAVIERAFGAMSQNSKELCALIECVAQISCLANNANGAILSGNPLQPVEANRVGDHGRYVESAIQDLCLHIAEHPFPGEKSSQLPYSLLAKAETSQSSGIVPVSGTSKNAWWDLNAAVLSKTNLSMLDCWTQEIFGHALLGVEILNSGLTVLMKQPLKNLGVEMSLVRGLFRLSRAAQSVDAQLELLFDVSAQVDYMETDTAAKSSVPQSVQVEYLRKIGRKLNCCVHKMLLALVHRVKQFKQEPENRLTHVVADYCKAIADCLDHTEIASQGIPCSVGKETASGRELAGVLRGLLIMS